MSYDAFMSYSHAADGLLAPRLQAALHRLAKPLFAIRALHVFRDQTSLSASPALWPSIVEALDRSRFFILMASPTAAASTWVQREVEHWLTHSPMAGAGKAVDQFLVVLTDGEIVWDEQARDFDWSRTTALPALLRGVFAHEPLFVDLRTARTDLDLSLHNPEFRSRVADLAAPLHGRPKDALIGEDVRVVRRNRRLAASAIVALSLLLLAASVAAYVAIVQRDTARSRELAARAVAYIETDPAQSLPLAIAAVETAATHQAVDALREALIRSSVRAVLRPRDGRVIDATFSPDGASVLALVGTDADRTSLHLWETATGAQQCVIADAREARWAMTGTRLMTRDGRAFQVPRCESADPPSAAADADVPHRWLFAVNASGQDLADPWSTAYRDEEGRLELAYVGDAPTLRDVRTGRVVRTLHGMGDPPGGAAFSEERNLVLTWARKDLYTESGGGPTEIGEKHARLWGVEYADRDAILAGHRRALNTAVFAPGGPVMYLGTLIATGSDDRTARLWWVDSSAADEFAVLTGHDGSVERVAISPDGTRVLTVSSDGSARLWDPGVTRPSALTPGDLFALRYAMPLPALQGARPPVDVPQLSADRRVIVASVGPSELHVWDSRTGALQTRITDEQYGDVRGVPSPDGTRVVTTTGDPRTVWGEVPPRVWDAATGTIVGTLGEDSGAEYAATWHPDGRQIVVVGEEGVARFWNARTFTLEHTLQVSDQRVLHAAFSADGTRLVTAGRDSLARIWDVRRRTLQVELFGHVGGVLHAGFSPDDALVVTVGEDGTRVWDATNGRLLGRYLGWGEPAIAFITPDCQRLVTGTFTRVGQAMRVHTFGACGPREQLLDVGRRRVARLTATDAAQ